jgi:hypothetical protein
MLLLHPRVDLITDRTLVMSKSNLSTLVSWSKARKMISPSTLISSCATLTLLYAHLTEQGKILPSALLTQRLLKPTMRNHPILCTSLPNQVICLVIHDSTEAYLLFFLQIAPYAPSQSQQGANQFVMHVNPMMQNTPPPNFQLSNCNWLASILLSITDYCSDVLVGKGRKRALLIGINYFKTKNELRGKGANVNRYVMFVSISLISNLLQIANRMYQRRAKRQKLFDISL